MKKWDILSVCEHPELIELAAKWQSSKWSVPLQAYLDSMEEGKTAEKSGSCPGVKRCFAGIQK